MNKKAQQETMEMTYIFNFLVVIIILVMMIAVVSDYLNPQFETKGLENAIITNNLIASSNCFAYEEERVYPGTIDLSKINDLTLARCTDKLGLGSKLEITDLNGKSLATADANKGYWLNVCESKQDLDCSQIEKYILYAEKGEIQPGILKLEVARVV